MAKINLNFTLSDIESMLEHAQNVDEGEQEIVFEWNIDDIDVSISVGDDTD